MDALLQLINEQLNNEQYSRIVFIALTAAAALAFCFSISILINSLAAPFYSRKRVLTRVHIDRAHTDSGSKVLDSLDPLSRLLAPKKEIHTSKIQQTLVHAGFRSENALKNFYAIKVVLLISSFWLVVFGAGFLSEVSNQQIFGYAVLGAVAGLLLPSYILDKLAAKRIKTIHGSFPDALDLLVVCVESGLGLGAALQRVAQELDVSHPELAEELNLVNVEIRAGVDRVDALRAMGERTGVEDIKGLVALLEQSIRFGGSIADTLRVYSEEFRDKRMQKAEEMAAKIGTKMIFPLTFCMWPSFFLIAVGPAILTVMEALGR